MSILGRLRKSPPEPRDDGAMQADSGDGSGPIAGYDKLDPKTISDSLRDHSQVELAAIEDYERAHEARPAVLNKLRYMRTDEPIDGYDAMDVGQIKEVLAGAETARVRAVRDYERKFQHRRSVLDEAARVLPDAQVSPEEARVSQAKADAVERAMRTQPDVT